jgi:deoxyribonuclease-4
MIRFGPAGLGGVKDAVSNLEEYHKLGLKACEIAFTYGVYIKSRKEAEEIGKRAKELDIKLSIHAPYYINLNSSDKKKIEQSKKRILDCCEVANSLGAYRVIFHPGFYGKASKEETYKNIKEAILEIKEKIKKEGWRVNIAPETTGKVNVFGSTDEIYKLVKETGCSFCIDFAHILAREKKVDFPRILKQFSEFKEIHIHFSGIEYGEKGERRHIMTDPKQLKELIENLNKYVKNHEIVVINESPEPIEDSKLAIKMKR